MAFQALVLPLLMLVLTGAGSPSPAPAGPPFAPAQSLGSWSWPVVGPVIRGFDPPDSPYGAGHRGIDIAVAAGTPIVAPESGTVTFAGKVGGELFITIDHGGGLSSTYSWVASSGVRKGDVVTRGQPIGTSGTGHPGSAIPHLHLGMKLDGAYLDPLELLGPLGVQDLIRLVPILT